MERELLDALRAMTFGPIPGFDEPFACLDDGRGGLLAWAYDEDAATIEDALRPELALIGRDTLGFSPDDPDVSLGVVGLHRLRRLRFGRRAELRSLAEKLEAKPSKREASDSLSIRLLEASAAPVSPDHGRPVRKPRDELGWRAMDREDEALQMVERSAPGEHRLVHAALRRDLRPEIEASELCDERMIEHQRRRLRVEWRLPQGEVLERRKADRVQRGEYRSEPCRLPAQCETQEPGQRRCEPAVDRLRIAGQGEQLRKACAQRASSS
ncbi:hypothetical protein WME91_51015 [Sorangium sp. So ce269]